jgi:hypothetical protein
MDIEIKLHSEIIKKRGLNPKNFSIVDGESIKSVTINNLEINSLDDLIDINTFLIVLKHSMDRYHNF